MKRILVSLIILSFGFSLAYAEGKDEVVARVGKRVITKAEFERLLSKRGGDFSKNKQMKISMLNNLVQSIALADAARKKGLDKRKDIKEILELTINSLLANELVKEEVFNKAAVTDSQVKAYYDKNLNQFKNPEQVRARHILIRTERTASVEDKKKAREKAEEVLKKIKAGEDFAKLATDVSDDPGSKSKGGDLGFFPRGRMAKPFEESAFSLKPGQLSEIVESPFGFHIIKVEEKKAEEIPAFEGIQDKVRTRALEDAKRELVKEFVEKVMKEAEVKIYAEVLEAEKK